MVKMDYDEYMPLIPFKDAIGEAEKILSKSLEGAVSITFHDSMTEELVDAVYRIDNQLFREELWYSRDELLEMFSRNGFFCFLVYLDGLVVAYDFGFDESEKVFFSDSTATLIERKGIGTLLVVLELVYLYEKGYKKVRFKTEELDQAGRPLREIWEKRGYKMVSSDDKGITMELVISEDVVEERINRFLLPRNG